MITTMLKKLAYIILCITLCPSISASNKENNSSKTSNATAAEWTFVPAQLIMMPAYMELGTVHVGDTIVQEFNVGNISDNRCLLSFRPTCDCVSFTLKPSNVIEPHTSSILKVKFIAKKPKKEFECKIDFVGNIKFQPFFLRITGKIIE